MFFAIKLFHNNFFSSPFRVFSSMSKKAPILQGIRILDVSRILVGPLSSMILSDLGAEVIKVESFEGDETRKWGPPYNNSSSTYFLSINRNKKSIALNLKTPEGLQTLYDLAKISDIFLENFSISVAKSLKIDYDTLKLINSRLIYGSVSGYGDKGPLANSPGFDATIQSYSGLMHITGAPDGEPTRVGVAITDVLTGYIITNGILAGLFHREKTGEGSYVKTSLLETALSSLVNINSAYLNGGVSPKRIGNHHPSIVPYGTYCVKDEKYMTIACGTDQQFQGFMRVLGLEITKEFENNQERVKNRKKLNEILNEELKKYELEDIVKKLQDAKIPAMPLNDVKAALESPQVKAMGIVKRVEDVKNHKELKFVKTPLNFEGFEEKTMEEPPMLNEHVNYVLKDLLKYDDEKIQELVRKNAVLDPKINGFSKI